MLASKPVLRDIVLVGGGHSHVVVLHSFAMRPLPGVRLTLICTDTDTPYSGMLPGYIAGHYGFDDVHIDLRRLAEFAGARYLRDEVIGIDRAERKVLCRERPPVSYDALSINIGSTPQLGGVPGAAEHAVPVKPIRRFNQRWLALFERVRAHAGPATIAVVGAGAAGVELTLAMQYRLRNELKPPGARSGRAALPPVLGRSRKSCRRTMPPCAALSNPCWPRAASACIAAPRSARSAPGACRCAVAPRLDADEIVWVTQAGGAAWLKDTGLALDESGFIRIGETLQSETDPLIFAAGDCAAMTGYRWKRPASSPCAWACRWPRTCAAASPARSPAPLPPAIALAGPDQHRRPPRGGVARLALRARRLDLALEGLDRPPLHAQVLRAVADDDRQAGR
jgi:selenide,water dikinase